MTRAQQLDWLIRWLAPDTVPPADENDKWNLFHSLVNMRDPLPVSKTFLEIQDSLLQSVTAVKGITDSVNLLPAEKNIYLWQGDITTLRADAVVNAANSALLGCFYPLHGCIDNAIHTFAGVQLRLECAKIMNEQGCPEPAGGVKCTSAYNLPASYVFHTVGPIVQGALTQKHCNQLISCYQSCLKLAEEKHLHTIAFCCISTGEFHFPNEAAAKLAVQTVREFIKKNNSKLKVIFNVYKQSDLYIYRKLLGNAAQAEAGTCRR